MLCGATCRKRAEKSIGSTRSNHLYSSPYNLEMIRIKIWSVLTRTPEISTDVEEMLNHTSLDFCHRDYNSVYIELYSMYYIIVNQCHLYSVFLIVNDTVEL